MKVVRLVGLIAACGVASFTGCSNQEQTGPSVPASAAAPVSAAAVSASTPEPEWQVVPRPRDPASPGSIRVSSEMRALCDKFCDRLIFKTDEARRMVVEFDVPCPHAKDGRYLPLTNVLLARLAQMDGKVVYATTVVDSRNGEVRIVDVVRRRSDGKVTDQVVALTMNSWGELRSGGINVEAVQNACYGSYGPIWVVSK